MTVKADAQRKAGGAVSGTRAKKGRGACSRADASSFLTVLFVRKAALRGCIVHFSLARSMLSLHKSGRFTRFQRTYSTATQSETQKDGAASRSETFMQMNNQQNFNIVWLGSVLKCLFCARVPGMQPWSGLPNVM